MENGTLGNFPQIMCERMKRKFYKLCNCSEYNKRDKQVMQITIDEIFDTICKEQPVVMMAIQSRHYTKIANTDNTTQEEQNL